MSPPYDAESPSSPYLSGSVFAWSGIHDEGSAYKGRRGKSEVKPIPEQLTPDQPEDRIYRGWELHAHEFPWMVKLKV